MQFFTRTVLFLIRTSWSLSEQYVRMDGRPLPPTNIFLTTSQSCIEHTCTCRQHDEHDAGGMMLFARIVVWLALRALSMLVADPIRAHNILRCMVMSGPITAQNSSSVLTICAQSKNPKPKQHTISLTHK